MESNNINSESEKLRQIRLAEYQAALDFMCDEDGNLKKIVSLKDFVKKNN